MARAPKSEIRSLTGLRGVAALLVVCFHFLMLRNFGKPATSLISHGYLAVDIFFVLSGFVMALSYRRMFAHGFSPRAYLKFLGRRIARVYPLYLAGTLVAFVLSGTGHIPYAHKGSLWVMLLENVLMVQAWGLNFSFDFPAWSISTEWAAYLLFPLLLIPTLQRRSWLAWVTGLLALATLAVICFLPTPLLHRFPPGALLDVADPDFAVPVWRCIAEFSLGLLAFRVFESPTGAFLTSRAWPATVICCSILGLMCFPGTDLGIVALVPLLIISIAAGNRLPARLLGARPIEFLGRISYSIYIVHGVFFVFVIRLIERLTLHGFPHSRVTGALLGIALVILVASFVYNLLEVPGRHWIRRALERPRADRRAAIAADLNPEPGEF